MSAAIVKDGSIVRKPGAFEKRIHEIDFIRGFLIGLVLMDHIFCWLWQYNLSWADSARAAGHSYEFYQAIGKFFEFYWYSTVRQVVRYFALFGFTFVSGISCAFSKNNWIRVAQMVAFSGLLFVGSNILNSMFADSLGLDTMRIDFNVIAVLAWSTLFYCFTQGKTWRSIVVGLLITLLIGWYFLPWLQQYSYQKDSHLYAPPFLEPSSPQADWMPLFPFISFFFMGALFSYFIYAPTKQSIVKHRGNWERPLCFMGRHSLVIYVCHQAILIPFFLLLNIFLGK